MISRKGPRRSLSEQLDMLAAGVKPEMIDPCPDRFPDEEDDLDGDPYHLSFDDYLDRDIELRGPMVEVPPGSVTECARSLGALIGENETLWDLQECGAGWARPSLRPRDIRGITPELCSCLRIRKSSSWGAPAAAVLPI